MDYKTNITVNSKGEKITERTFLIQVNNKQENWLAEIEIEHNPQLDFSFNYGRIIDRKGNIVKKIKEKDFITRSKISYQAFYQDDLVSEIDAYWHEYPYQIEYSYTIIEEEFLFVSWWSPLLFTNISTIKSSLQINIPNDYQIKYSQSGNFDFQKSEQDGRKTLAWHTSKVIPQKVELFSPPFKEIIPKVMVVPIHFKYGNEGSTENWTSFGTWLNKLNDGTDQLPAGEKITIDKITENCTNVKETIKKIYYFLQDNTSYVNVAIDVGGLKSYPASYVYHNKYGDCKALTTYMKAMLKSVGIESHYTVINAGKNEAIIDQEIPSQQFNHVILTVPLEQDTVWLENTSNSLPFNYLGTFTQNRMALSVNGENSKLIRTPKLTPTNVLEENNYSFLISDIESIPVTLSLKLRGSKFEEFRYLILEKDRKRLQNAIIDASKVENVSILNWDVKDFHRDSTHINLTVNGKTSGLVRNIGSWKVINPLMIDIPEFEKPEERQLEVRLNYPIHKFYKYVFVLIDMDITEFQLPESINIESKYGHYFASYSLSGDKLIVEEKFLLSENIISLDHYSEFYSFIESIINHKKQSALLIK